MKEITSENVHSIFMACLFTDDEEKVGIPKNFVEVTGVQNHIGFNPDRIKCSEQDIFDMLLQLPEQFLQSVGGGWSFLNACNNKENMLWTGEHRIMDELVCLGLAIKKVFFLLPRAIWQALPGGMPYFMVLDIGQVKQVAKSYDCPKEFDECD